MWPEARKGTQGGASRQQLSRGRLGAQPGGAPSRGAPRRLCGCSQACMVTKEPRVSACRHLGWRATHSGDSGQLDRDCLRPWGHPGSAVFFNQPFNKVQNSLFKDHTENKSQASVCQPLD